MEITLNETDYCKLTVNVVANKEEIDAKRNEVISHFKNAPVKGFRDRAPLDAIRMTYRSQINESLKRSMAEEVYNTLFEKNLKPLSQPNFTDIMLLDHKFSCDFSFNCKPTFELAPYKEMTFPHQPVKQSIEDVTQLMMQELRVKFGETVPYSDEDKVQLGDVIVVNYSAFDGEVALDAVSGSGEVLTVGKIGLPGFDEELVGMKVDETKSFTVHIPEGGLPSLINKDIRFEVKLIMGSKNFPMPLNDELAKKTGRETFAELVEAVAATASLRHGEMNREAQLKQVSARLVADNEIKVPSWLAQSEAQYLAASAKLSFETMKPIDQEKFLHDAEANVKMALILDAIREVEPEAQLSDEEVLNMLRAQAAKSGNGKDPDKVLADLNQNGQLALLTARIRDEFTLDFLLKHAIITQ